MLGELNARSTSTTRELRASERANAMAVRVVPTSRALPITATRRPPSPARRSAAATSSTGDRAGRLGRRDGSGRGHRRP